MDATDCWKRVAREEGIDLSGHLMVLPEIARRGFYKDCKYVVVYFKMQNLSVHGYGSVWAATSLLFDGPMYAWAIEDQFKIARGSLGDKDVGARHVTLSTTPIVKSQFEERYPDVPWKEAYRFVMYHELGHVIMGQRECCADEYAFAEMQIKQSKKGRSIRNAVYPGLEQNKSNVLALMRGLT